MSNTLFLKIFVGWFLILSLALGGDTQTQNYDSTLMEVTKKESPTKWVASNEFGTFLNEDTKNSPIVGLFNGMTILFKSGSEDNILFAIVVFMASFVLLLLPFGPIAALLYIANALYYNNPAAILGGTYDMIIYLIRMFLSIFGLNI